MSQLNVKFVSSPAVAGLLIVPLFEGGSLPPFIKEIDHTLKGGVQFNITREKFKGSKGQLLALTTNGQHPFSNVLLCGLGKESSLSPLDVQEAGGWLHGHIKEDKIVIEVRELGSQLPAELAFGMLLKGWEFDKYRTLGCDPVKEVTFLCDAPDQSRASFRKKENLYQGVALARELTAEPANRLFPEAFAERCRELQNYGVTVDVLDENELQNIGANALLSVGKGSVNPPRLVVMHWQGTDAGTAPIVLAGKGICFDSGGINIKTTDLLEMKYDKAAATAVTGVIKTLALEKAPVNVVGVVGLAENMVDGASMKPGDIITTLSKKTVEIVDTDYEGRLVLADCLWYAQEKYRVSIIIDLGTLTPETVAPLGGEYAGLYCEDNALVQDLIEAGRKSGEKVWQLPMGEPYARQIESDCADLKNMGIPGYGEGAAAAEFLKSFIREGIRWAHLDIAGVAWSRDDTHICRKGTTGYGVRLLIEWLSKQIG